MSSPTSELAVRGSARYQCGFDAQVSVAQEHARLVKTDKSAPGAGGPAAMTLVDFSLGGAGLRSPLFFPRLCRLVLTFTPPGAADPMSVELRVHRVSMLDRSPSYYLGTAYESLTAEQTQSILQVVQHLKASGAKLVPELPRG
jgi:hypothetical protein